MGQIQNSSKVTDLNSIILIIITNVMVYVPIKDRAFKIYKKAKYVWSTKKSTLKVMTKICKSKRMEADISCKQ